MENETKLIEKAEFKAKFSTYILLLGAFIITITFNGTPLLLIWFLGIGMYFGKRYYKSLRCELTTRHLEFNQGIFFKVEKTIPLENIQDLTFVENLILSYLDLKILKIETAGNSGSNGSDMKLVGIIGAHEFKRKVLLQRELLQSDSGTNSNSIQNTDVNTELLKKTKAVLKEIN